jgi:aminopeptidase
MNFQEKLDVYAKLLVYHGLNVQPGQMVNVTGEFAHKELIHRVVFHAYKKGAKFVNVDFVDPYLNRIRVQESLQEEFLQYVPRFIPVKYDDFIEEGGCVLRLTGSAEPDILSDLPANKVNSLQTALRKSLKRYFIEGIGKMKVQWTVAAAATPKWGKKVFPELDENKAYEALWDAIFHICRADTPDCLERWKRHNKSIQERARKLTDLKIKELHFTGPGTDLKVVLSPKAIFTGGGSTTTRGIDFEANIPTEECFTTPDCRYTEGKVRVTRPVLVNGKLIQGLEIEFKNGEITKFSATDGYDQFAAYISNDPGAKRLGEVALVGTDSPVFQSGRHFGEILYDENAACHIAIGSAYRFCIDGGPMMSQEELQEVGCNDSSLHTDFMISSEAVDVVATTYSGTTISLIEKGQWKV